MNTSEISFLLPNERIITCDNSIETLEYDEGQNFCCLGKLDGSVAEEKI